LGVRFVERWDFKPTWFRDTLQVNLHEIYWLKDSSAYELQFYDDPKSEIQQGKYKLRINLPELGGDTRNYRLLHLGTLFGSSRLRLSIRENKYTLMKVREAMTLANPYLNRLAGEIVTALGGVDTYFSIHLRVGDGLENSQTIWWMLLRSVVGLSDDVIEALQSSTLSALSLKRPSTGHTAAVVPLQSPKGDLCATARKASALYTPVFIATDARDPHTHPALQIFRSTLPCIFFGSDFPWVERQLSHIVNPLDNSPMSRFFLSFLDAVVASRGATVIGTPESTFSRYIGEVLWPQYHN